MFSATKLFCSGGRRPQVTIKGANGAQATSVTIPSHAVGDLILIFAVRASTALPGKPAASGTVPAWVDIDASVQGSGYNVRTAYYVATATNHTSGAWASSTAVAAVVLSGQNASNPIGGHASNGYTASAGAYPAPAVTMSNTDGSSQLISYAFQAYAVFNSWTVPGGYTSLITANYSAACASKDDTTSDGSVPFTYRTQSQPGGAAQVEICA